MSRTATAAAPATNEIELTARDFREIADILYADSGIHLTEGKASLVYSRLSKRLRALGLTRFRDYCDLVQRPEGGAERAALLSALTTNVTRFFREPHHFDALREQIAKDLSARAQRGERVRLWSAGCSNGHEPYSMAMTLLSAMPDAGRLDVRILATDIDPIVVDRARAGEYDDDAVDSIPAALRSRFLQKQGSAWRVSDDVRALLRFGVLNLHADWPMKGGFDVIFCRNVAIYFDEPTQKRLWSRFAERLTPTGRLYIGHSERTESPELENDGLTMYRRRRR